MSGGRWCDLYFFWGKFVRKRKHIKKWSPSPGPPPRRTTLRGKVLRTFSPKGGFRNKSYASFGRKKSNKMQQNSNAWRVAPSSILRAKRKHILTLESVFALRSQYSEKKSKIMPQWSKYAPKRHQSVINRSTWQAWEHI